MIFIHFVDIKHEKLIDSLRQKHVFKLISFKNLIEQKIRHTSPNFYELWNIHFTQMRAKRAFFFAPKREIIIFSENLDMKIQTKNLMIFDDFFDKL